MDRPQRPQRSQNQMQNGIPNQMPNSMQNGIPNQQIPIQNGVPNQQRPIQNPNQINMQKANQGGAQNNQPISMNKGNNSAPINPQDDPNLSAEEKVFYMMEEKKRKRKKAIITTLIVVLGVGALATGIYFIATGRWSHRVTSLEAQVNSLNQTIEDNKAAWATKQAEYEQAIADSTVKEYIPETSLQRVEASDVPTLWLPEGDFMAPNALNIPGISESVNDSNIKIGPSFLFKPSDRWIMVSQGTTFEFSHPQKIWGKIKALNIKDSVPEADMQNIVKDFFVGYPATTITYRKIFISDYVRGCLGRATVTVNYDVVNPVEYEEPVEMEVEVDEEYEEIIEVEVPVMKKVTNEDGTISEVQDTVIQTNEDGTTTEVPKTRKEKQKVPATKKVTKTTTIMQTKTRDETSTLQKDITINVGFVYMSDYALSFLFVHEADNDASSQELVDSLLKSGYYKTTDYMIKLE